MERWESRPGRESNEDDVAAFRSFYVFEENARFWDGGLVSEAICAVRTDRAHARIEAHIMHEEQH